MFCSVLVGALVDLHTRNFWEGDDGAFGHGGYTVCQAMVSEGSLVFQREAREPAGSYRAEILAGEMRQKSHQAKVPVHLDEGAARGWRLVSANTTNATGSYVTGIYWDTTPER